MKPLLISTYFFLLCLFSFGQDSLATKRTFSVFYKPAYASISIKANGGPANLDFIYNEEVKGIVTNSFGANLSFLLSPKLSVLTGLERDVIGYQTDSMPSVNLKWVRYRLSYLQVPVKFQYEIASVLNWKLLGRIGFGARFLTDISADYRLQDGFENQVFDAPNGYSKFAYAGLLDFGAQKNINSKLSFGFEVNSLFQIANIAVENLHISSSSFGCSFRLNRHF
jgi:hypothetical protein